MQKFVLRSALRPNQISFLHGLDPERTALVRRNSRVSPVDRWYLLDRGEELAGLRAIEAIFSLA
jgi:hypothetical protein